METPGLDRTLTAVAKALVVRGPRVKLEIVLFALVLGAYAYFYQAGGWNQNTRLDLTRAIVEQGTVRIDAYADNTGDQAHKDGHYYCDKAPGLSWMAVPPYAAIRGLVPLALASWFVTVVTVAVPSALACTLFPGLLIAWGVRVGPAYAAAVGWAVATLAWPYGTLFYGHQTVASLLLAAFALTAVPRAYGEAASASRMAAVGGLLGWAVVVEYQAALASVAIAGYGVWVYGWRRGAWMAVGAAPPAIALAAYHWVVFGSPITTPYRFSNQHSRSQGFFMGIGLPKLAALWGILFSEYRGLFYSEPWLGFAVPGGVRLWRTGRRAEVIVCSMIALFFVWLNASLVNWEGGWAMGARYLVPCLPFLALLVGGLFAGRRSHALLVVLIAPLTYAFLAMLAGTAVKPEVNLNVKTPFTSFLYPHFLRGELAVSTQSIDSAFAPPHAARQAWNLGNRIGLGGLASLLPLGLWFCTCGGFIIRGVRRAAPLHFVSPRPRH